MYDELTLCCRATEGYKDTQQWQDLSRNQVAIAGMMDQFVLDGYRSHMAEIWAEFKSLVSSVSIALHGFKKWDLEADTMDCIGEALDVMEYARCT